MKIGMILECGPYGADKKVYEYLAKQLDPHIVVVSSTLGSKSTLVELCGTEARALLELESCERVIIVWDLYPPWQERRQRPCRFNDCKYIKGSLNEAGLTERQLERVYLVCIETELETLLLADAQALEMYLNSITRRSCRIGRLRNPEHLTNPKGRLSQIFQEQAGRKYLDMRDAEKIIKLVNIDKIWRCSSFVRFADKVADVSRHEF
jgi:Domain of unknown function (DUF4276)